jgi:hypothetical protein
MARKGKSLKGYEGMNLLFFMGFLVILGGFVFFIFNSYKLKNDLLFNPPRPDNGIVQEVRNVAIESCLFYVDRKLSDAPAVYSSQKPAPADNELVKELLELNGVAEVKIDAKLIVIRKMPSAHWEIVQPTAREVIIEYFERTKAK